MIKLTKCVVCKSKKLANRINVADHSFSKEIFTVVSCETCGFKFTSPRPKKKDIINYYNSTEYISHNNSSKGIVNWLYKKIRVYTIKSKTSLLKKYSKVGLHLDIGCGTGEFLNACQKIGFKVFGVEPSEKARKQAVKNYNISVSENMSLKSIASKKFNSISMWHVLEHVYDLEEHMCQLKRILKDDGVLIVGLPNNKSWDCSYYKV